MSAQPIQDLLSVSIRGKDRVENVFENAPAHNHRKTFEQSIAGSIEGGQFQGLGKNKIGVRDHLEWQRETLNDFTLVVGVLAG